jgi:hypothetical protein
MCASRKLVALCGLLLLAGAIAGPADASDATLRAKLTTSISVLLRDGRHFTIGNQPAEAANARTDMIIRRARISSDTASTSRGRTGKSLAVQGLNEIIAACAALERETDANTLTVGQIFVRRWAAGWKLLHAASVELRG